jgi:hypothetical protein
MRTATGLALVAIGAILALAVISQPSFINLHIAGVVIALTGVAGLLIPRRGYGWLLRRVVVRRGPRGQVSRTEDRRVPPYLVLNPGRSGPPPQGTNPGDMTTVTIGAETSPLRTGGGEPPDAGARPAEETVEEFIEE